MFPPVLSTAFLSSSGIPPESSSNAAVQMLSSCIVCGGCALHCDENKAGFTTAREGPPPAVAGAPSACVVVMVNVPWPARKKARLLNTARRVLEYSFANTVAL
jgi:hypothetical protein